MGRKLNGWFKRVRNNLDLNAGALDRTGYIGTQVPHYAIYRALYIVHVDNETYISQY